MRLRRKVAILDPSLREADLRTRSERFFIGAWVRGMTGLAAVGLLGGWLGEGLLARTIEPTARFAGAVQVGVGSAIVAATAFAILGALGHVAFADLVGDCPERRRTRTSAASAIEECVVEFIGGATWGTVCGALIGGVAAAGTWLATPAAASPVVTGTVGGAIMGSLLALAGFVARWRELIGGIRGPFASIGRAAVPSDHFSPRNDRESTSAAVKRGVSQ